jgi:hypothetical protein
VPRVWSARGAAALPLSCFGGGGHTFAAGGSLCSRRSSGDERHRRALFSPIVLSAPFVEQPLQARGNNLRGVASVATPAFTEQPSIVAEAIIWLFAKRACFSFHQRASYSFLTIWQKAGVAPPRVIRALVALLTWRDLLFCAKHLFVVASRHKQAPCHRHRHRRMKIIVAVSYGNRVGYTATCLELRGPVTALSLAVLRRRIEDQLRGEQADVRLVLDKRARQERDQRRRGGHGGAEQWTRTR